MHTFKRFSYTCVTFFTFLLHNICHINKNNSNNTHATKNHNTRCAISSAARLTRPGQRHFLAYAVPAPGRAVGYLPSRGDLWVTSPTLQTGRQPPPAPPGNPYFQAVPPSHRPGERSVDQTGRRPARQACRPAPS